MIKKTFKGGFDALLGDPYVIQEKTEEKDGINKDKIIEKRATFIIDAKILEKLKAMAFWDRTTIKDKLHEALIKYIKDYENKNGNIEIRSEKIL